MEHIVPDPRPDTLRDHCLFLTRSIPPANAGFPTN